MAVARDRVFRNTGGIKAVEALFKSHEAQGGTLININVISKEQ